MSDTTQLHQTQSSFFVKIAAQLKSYGCLIYSLMAMAILKVFPELRPRAPSREEVGRGFQIIHEKRRRRRSSASTVRSTTSTLVENDFPESPLMNKHALSRISEQSHSEDARPTLRPRRSSILMTGFKPVQRFSGQVTSSIVTFSKDLGESIAVAPSNAIAQFSRTPSAFRRHTISLNVDEVPQGAATSPVADSDSPVPKSKFQQRRSSFSKACFNSLKLRIPEKDTEERYESIYSGITDSHHPHPCASIKGDEPESYFTAPVKPKVIEEEESDASSTTTVVEEGAAKVEETQQVEKVVVEEKPPGGEKKFKMKRTVKKIKGVLRFRAAPVS